MNERDLFIEALDRPSLVERAAYLDRACTGDTSLRRRLEILLTAHLEASECLKAPAPFNAAPPPRTQDGSDTLPYPAGPGNANSTAVGLSQFEILAELGRGGMG